MLLITARNSTGEYVTLINPYNEKGFELAVKIAEQCKDIPFLFVESWKLSDEHRAEIERIIAPLGNVKLENRTSDMKTVYGRTKILLAPSKWEEAWGRVASEAHCSGIPVVGSTRGGLPEACPADRCGRSAGRPDPGLSRRARRGDP